MRQQPVRWLVQICTCWQRWWLIRISSSSDQRTAPTTYQGLRPILARGYCPQDDQRNVELVRLPFASKQAWCRPRCCLTESDNPDCRHVGPGPSHIELAARFVIRPTARRAGCALLQSRQSVAFAVSLLNRDLRHRFGPRIRHAGNQKGRQAPEKCGRHDRTHRCYRGGGRRAE